MDTTTAPSTNGTHPDAPEADGGSPLARLRVRPVNPHGFRGFGPLIALGVLLLLMVVLAPTVAPEEIVLKPTDTTDTPAPPSIDTSVPPPTTAAPGASTTAAVAP